MPWLVRGDMNEILYNTGKKDGPPRSAAAILQFQKVINDIGLRDLGYTRYRYTWSNKRERKHLVEARLDRFLGSYEWERFFNNYKIMKLCTI